MGHRQRLAGQSAEDIVLDSVGWYHAMWGQCQVYRLPVQQTVGGRHVRTSPFDFFGWCLRSDGSPSQQEAIQELEEQGPVTPIPLAIEVKSSARRASIPIILPGRRSSFGLKSHQLDAMLRWRGVAILVWRNGSRWYVYQPGPRDLPDHTEDGRLSIPLDLMREVPYEDGVVRFLHYPLEIR